MYENKGPILGDNSSLRLKVIYISLLRFLGVERYKFQMRISRRPSDICESRHFSKWLAGFEDESSCYIEASWFLPVIMEQLSLCMLGFDITYVAGSGQRDLST